MKTLALALLLLLAWSAAAQAHVNVVDCGAIGNGSAINTRAIQSALDKAAQNGGGTVLIPPGTFVSGTLHLRNNVDLHLEPGAILKGSPRLADYVLGKERVGLLYTQDAANVSISGPGTIDGNASTFIDEAHAKHMSADDTKYTRQGEHFREVANGLGDGPQVPHEQRPYQMIIFSNCRGVTVRDVTITGSPFWTLHCSDCDGVMISGVRIWNSLVVPNNDGIDCTDCQHVHVTGCDIRCGDDALVFTGYAHHHELPGYRDTTDNCSDIVVSNCTLQSRSSAIRIGGWDQHPMRNMIFDNIIIDDSNRGIGIFLRQRGSIENLSFSNMIIRTRLHTGDWWGNGEPIHLSVGRVEPDVPLGVLRNVRFRGITCESPTGIVIYGDQERSIDDVTFDDVSLHVVDDPLNSVAGGNFDLRPLADNPHALFAHDVPGIYAQYVRNLRLRHCGVTWDPNLTQPWFTNAVSMNHAAGAEIDVSGTAAPAHPDLAPILLQPGR